MLASFDSKFVICLEFGHQKSVWRRIDENKRLMCFESHPVSSEWHQPAVRRPRPAPFSRHPERAMRRLQVSVRLLGSFILKISEQERLRLLIAGHGLLAKSFTGSAESFERQSPPAGTALDSNRRCRPAALIANSMYSSASSHCS